MQESRIRKSILNAKINLIFYFLVLGISFFSRKIFLNYLGTEFLGLTGTLQNLLSFLNLADLGIGASIGYVLYKPIFDKDEKKITEIVSVLGYLYNRIGLIILVAGSVLSLFLPLIFSDTDISIGVLYAVYYGFLFSSLIGYFINYRQTLLGADQKNYVVAGYFQTANIIKIFVQMAVAVYWCNFYIWIIIEFSFNVIYACILNYKINKTYPWLHCSVGVGKQHYKEHKIIITKAKQMFVHVLAGMGRNQLLPFLIYVYGSLSTVTYYGNYTIITLKIQQLFDNLLNSTGAGVGNLIAQGNLEKIKEIYWELQGIRMAVAAFTMFAFYTLINPFITIWLGEKYLLSSSIVIVLILIVFLAQTRGTTEQFIYGYGLFQDVWAPVATLMITVGVGLIGGYYFGLAGVIAGDCCSSLFILHIWKPYFLFKCGFRSSIWEYRRKQLLLLLIIIISFLMVLYIKNLLQLDIPYTYWEWTKYSVIITFLYLSVFIPVFYICFKPVRLFIKRLTGNRKIK